MIYLTSHKYMTKYWVYRNIRLGKDKHRSMIRYSLGRIRIDNWSPQSKQPLRLVLYCNFHIYQNSIACFPVYCKFVLKINKVYTRGASDFLICYRYVKEKHCFLINVTRSAYSCGFTFWVRRRIVKNCIEPSFLSSAV